VKLIALLCQRIRWASDRFEESEAVAGPPDPLAEQRIRWASDRFEESVLLPLQVRLARRLCALATDFGSEVYISQEQLGIYVGAARESVNRQLQQWRQQGILEIRRGRILLLNANRLRAEAREG